MRNKLVKTALTLGLATLVTNVTIPEKVVQAADKTVYIAWTQSSPYYDFYTTQMQENFGRYKLVNSARTTNVCGRTLCANSFATTIDPSSTLLFRISGNSDTGDSTEFSEPKSPSNSSIKENAFICVNHPPKNTFTNKETYFYEGFVFNTTNPYVTINNEIQSINSNGYFKRDIPLFEGLNKITTDFTNHDGTPGELVTTIIKDTLGPSITVNPFSKSIITPTSIKNNQLKITGTAQDAYSVKDIKCNGYPKAISKIGPEVVSWANPIYLHQGTNDITCYATDSSGNRGEAFRGQTFYDSMPPRIMVEFSRYYNEMNETSIYNKDGAQKICTKDPNYVLKVNVKDPSKSSAEINGKLYPEVTNPLEYTTQWKENDNPVQVTATDEYSHSSTKTFDVILDRTPLTFTFDKPFKDSQGNIIVSGASYDNCGVSSYPQEIIVKIDEVKDIKINDFAGNLYEDHFKVIKNASGELEIITNLDVTPPIVESVNYDKDLRNISITFNEAVPYAEIDIGGSPQTVEYITNDKILIHPSQSDLVRNIKENSFIDITGKSQDDSDNIGDISYHIGAKTSLEQILSDAESGENTWRKVGSSNLSNDVAIIQENPYEGQFSYEMNLAGLEHGKSRAIDLPLTPGQRYNINDIHDIRGKLKVPSNQHENVRLYQFSNGGWYKLSLKLGKNQEDGWSSFVANNHKAKLEGAGQTGEISKLRLRFCNYDSFTYTKENNIEFDAIATATPIMIYSANQQTQENLDADFMEKYGSNARLFQDGKNKVVGFNANFSENYYSHWTDYNINFDLSKVDELYLGVINLNYAENSLDMRFYLGDSGGWLRYSKGLHSPIGAKYLAKYSYLRPEEITYTINMANGFKPQGTPKSTQDKDGILHYMESGNKFRFKIQKKYGMTPTRGDIYFKGFGVMDDFLIKE